MSIELVKPPKHLILCCPLLLLPSIFPSIRVFSNELALCNRCHGTGTSASASVLPMNIQGWFRLGLTDLICLQFKGLSRVFSCTTIRKHQFFSIQPSLWSNSHIHIWLLGNYGFDCMDLCWQSDFNTLSRFTIAFLPRSKHMLISWLQWLSTQILELKKRKFVTASTFSPSIFVMKW